METQYAATDLEQWALIVVDMQNDFLSADGYYAPRRELDERIREKTMTAEARNQLLSQPSKTPALGFRYRVDSLRPIVANIASIIDHARTQHRPIGYLQAIYSRECVVQPPFLLREPQREHYPCKPNSWGAEFIEPIVPLISAGRTASLERVIEKHTFDGFCQTELLQFLRDNNVQTVVIVGVETHVCVLSTAQSASINQFKTIILEDCVWSASEGLGQGALAIFRDAFGSTLQCTNDWLKATVQK